MKKTTLTMTLVMIACCITATQGIADQVGGGSSYQLQGDVTYAGGILTKFTMRPSPGTDASVTPILPDAAPPAAPGIPFVVDSFFDVFFDTRVTAQTDTTFAIDSFFDITYEIEIPGGSAPHVGSAFNVLTHVETGPRDPGEAVQDFDTEMVALSLSGNVGGASFTIQESLSQASTGLTKITDLGGGDYSIDSFFDISTELSVDGGTFSAGTPAAHTILVPNNPTGTIYDIQKDQALYGNLDQDDIPNGGKYMCGPTAVVNSFIYLQNKYPGTFGTDLVPPGASNGQDLDGDGIFGDSYDDMIAIAQILGDPQHMNTQPTIGGGSSTTAAGTWDDMLIFGKWVYMENVLPGVTVYGAEMDAVWAWPGRPATETPGIPKPSWVQDGVDPLFHPSWRFLYDELVACEDVEILIVDEGWGHYLTVTGFVWNDANGDGVVDAAEGAVIHYIDPATGLAGTSSIRQNGLDQQLLVSYGTIPNAQLIMTVKESTPEPATISFLALGGLALLRRKRRRV
ncbi:MAG: PEP-CTERM sorting domain-containing protein [Phycisphaerae bacterium]|jgi:hypothetical protein|nr:PEP-CTERM sorting domain-containing protein [Phycisphaerae bacterium]